MELIYKVQKKVIHNQFLYWIVALTNLGGGLFGYVWYQNQLQATPWIFWPLTPDCPNAAIIFLIWFLLPRRDEYHTFRLIAVTGLIKYGIWTVSVIGLYWIDHSNFRLDQIILFISHVGMLIEGIVFTRGMKINKKGLIFTTIWLILNDFIDYYFNVYPWLPDYDRFQEIRLGTFVLTGLIIVWLFSRRSKIKK